MSKTAGLFGKISFAAGVLMDARGVWVYYKNPGDPNSVHPSKMGLNTAVGAYGVWINPVAAVVYFGLDAFHPGGQVVLRNIWVR